MRARVEGADARAEADDAHYDEVGPGYFGTLGIPIVRGREFTDADSASSPKVAILNEQFVRRFGLGRDAVGKRISRGSRTLDFEIVGVVADAKHGSLTKEVEPIFFVPHRQDARRPGVRAFFVRTSLGSADAMAAIRQAVHRLDSNLPIEKLRTMEDAVRGAMVQQRLMGTMTAAPSIVQRATRRLAIAAMMASTDDSVRS